MGFNSGFKGLMPIGAKLDSHCNCQPHGWSVNTVMLLCSLTPVSCNLRIYFYSRKGKADIRKISMAVNTRLIHKRYFIGNFADALQESAQ
jgi:hypothetical protein